MGGDEVVSGCRVLQTKQTSPSNAIATVEYRVTSKIMENADGSKSIVKIGKIERTKLHLSLVRGEWRIQRKSLMHVPEHATASAWADHFQRLVQSDPAKKSDIDRNLEKLIVQLQQPD